MALNKRDHLYEIWLVGWCVEAIQGFDGSGLREILEKGERIWSRRADLALVFDEVSSEVGTIDVASPGASEFFGIFWSRAQDPAQYGYSEELGRQLRARIEPFVSLALAPMGGA